MISHFSVTEMGQKIAFIIQRRQGTRLFGSLTKMTRCYCHAKAGVYPAAKVNFEV